VQVRRAGRRQSRKFVASGRGISGVLVRNTVQYLKRVPVERHCRCERGGSGERADQVKKGISPLTLGEQWDVGTRISGGERYTGHKEVPCHSQS